MMFCAAHEGFDDVCQNFGHSICNRSNAGDYGPEGDVVLMNFG